MRIVHRQATSQPSWLLQIEPVRGQQLADFVSRGMGPVYVDFHNPVSYFSFILPCFDALVKIASLSYSLVGHGSNLVQALERLGRLCIYNTDIHILSILNRVVIIPFDNGNFADLLLIRGDGEDVRVLENAMVVKEPHENIANLWKLSSIYTEEITRVKVRLTVPKHTL